MFYFHVLYLSLLKGHNETISIIRKCRKTPKKKIHYYERITTNYFPCNPTSRTQKSKRKSTNFCRIANESHIKRVKIRLIMNTLALWWSGLEAQKHSTEEADADDYDDGMKGTTKWNKWIVVGCSRDINLLWKGSSTPRDCPRLILWCGVRTCSLLKRINISEAGLIKVFWERYTLRFLVQVFSVT